MEIGCRAVRNKEAEMEDVGMDVVQVTRERITFIPIFFIQINVLLGLKYSILSRVI